MKIIFASKFFYRRGGLEAYLFNAKNLLEENGHIIIPFSTNHHKNIITSHSDYFCKYMDISKIDNLNVKHNINAFMNMFFNYEAYFKIKKLCDEEHPALLQGFGVTKHLSASIFKAAKEKGLKTIMRLSDYALMCPNSIALDGSNEICNAFDCIRKLNIKCVKRKCIKHSLLASAIGLLEVKINGLLRYYKRYVDHWIAPSNFIKNIFITHYKIPKEKITFLPIFFDTKDIEVSKENEGYILYAGRISEEKGILTLLKAIERKPSLKLKIAGTGPIENEMKNIVLKKGLNVEFLGFQAFAELKDLIKKASILVIPSECYENSPNIVLEAYAYGKPVVGSNIGGIPELVANCITGYLFEPKNEQDLLDKINQALNEQAHLGLNGRKFLESDFNQEKHYENLMEIYSSILKNND